MYSNDEYIYTEKFGGYIEGEPRPSYDGTILLISKPSDSDKKRKQLLKDMMKCLEDPNIEYFPFNAKT